MKPSRATLALVVALLALVAAIGTPAVAARLVTGKGIKNSSVTGKDVRNGSLTGRDLRNRSVTAADLAPGAASDRITRVRVLATNGVDAASARLAAPRVVLFRQGAIRIYGKCYNDTSADVTYYGIYAASTRGGAILDSRNDELHGGTAADFLGPATDETDAELENDDTSADTASMSAEDDSDFLIFSPDGVTVRGWTGGAVKNGILPGGNGVYGGGDVCLFTSRIFSN